MHTKGAYWTTRQVPDASTGETRTTPSTGLAEKKTAGARHRPFRARSPGASTTWYFEDEPCILRANESVENAGGATGDRRGGVEEQVVRLLQEYAQTQVSVTSPLNQ